MLYPIRVSQDGTIQLPGPIRRLLALSAGTVLLVTLRGQDILLRPCPKEADSKTDL